MHYREIWGELVYGVDVDPKTRCAHYHSPVDIIAIKFKCCERWFPCFECHLEISDHAVEVWPKNEFDQPAILCGTCGHQLAIIEYMDFGAQCTLCQSDFNPRCANHYHLYFEVA